MMMMIDLKRNQKLAYGLSPVETSIIAMVSSPIPQKYLGIFYMRSVSEVEFRTTAQIFSKIDDITDATFLASIIVQGIHGYIFQRCASVVIVMRDPDPPIFYL
jgi:hypothetical protein